MNQQMTLLEARAVAHDRERQLRRRPRRRAHGLLRTLRRPAPALAGLGRHRTADASGTRAAQVAAARG